MWKVGIHVGAVLAAAAVVVFSSGAESGRRGHHYGRHHGVEFDWVPPSHRRYSVPPGFAGPPFVRPDLPGRVQPYRDDTYWFGARGAPGALDEGAASRPREERRAWTAGRSGELEGLARICDQQAQDLAAWPIEKIEQVVRPTDVQRTALYEVQTAASKAAETLRATCPVNVPQAPIGRLDAVEKSLDAMLQSLNIVRPAVENFYNSLNEEQKARLIVMISKASEEQDSSTSRRGLARVCHEPSSIHPVKWPIERVQYALRPTEAQRAVLDEFWATSNKAAKILESNCPTETPLTPSARLETMRQRLDALLQAVRTMRPALGNLYESLSDEQKARFNNMG